MSSHSELKRIAEMAPTGPWFYENESMYFNDDGYTRHLLDAESGHDVTENDYYAALKFIAAANPVAVLSLIAEVEGLRKLPTAWSEVYEQSDELDALRDEKLAWLNARDQLKAEVEKLRKDAERLDWLCGQSRPVVEGQTMSNPEGELAGYDWGVFGACGTVREAIDYAMSKRDQP